MIKSSTVAIPLALLLLSTVLLVAPASAHEPADDAEAAESAENVASEAEDDPPTPASGEDSPFDYQSSEEISEDLSVSFPVDI